MKRVALALLLVVLLAGTVSAKVTLPDAGVGPGSLWWGVDRALENINMILTFDRAERIRIGLSVAEERIAEAKAAYASGDPSDESAALVAYQQALDRVNTQLTAYDSSHDDTAFDEEVQSRLDSEKQALAELPKDSDAAQAIEAAQAKAAGLNTTPSAKAAVSTALVTSAPETPATDENTSPSDISSDETTASDGTAGTTEVNVVKNVSSSLALNGLNLTVHADVNPMYSDVTVTGDINRNFRLDSTDLANLTRDIAKIIGVTESEVQDALVMEVAAAKPKISVIVDSSNDITRINVTYVDGTNKKIVLSISDHDAIIKEIAKRTQLNGTLVNDVATFTVI
jgi:hypothetical protein